MLTNFLSVQNMCFSQTLVHCYFFISMIGSWTQLIIKHFINQRNLFMSSILSSKDFWVKHAHIFIREDQVHLKCDGIVFTWRVRDLGFEPWPGQIKDLKIGICCFFAKHAAIAIIKGVRIMCLGKVTYLWGNCYLVSYHI